MPRNPTETVRSALDFLRGDLLANTGDRRDSDIMDGSEEPEPVASAFNQQFVPTDDLGNPKPVAATIRGAVPARWPWVRAPAMPRAMNQLVALLAFLILTVGKTSAPGVGRQGQIAYVAGSTLGHLAIFMVLHALVYFGAKLFKPKETYASFVATRLNYLTLGILVFLLASSHIKH